VGTPQKQKRNNKKEVNCNYSIKSIEKVTPILNLLSRIKLQTPAWRCSGSPKGSSSFFACSQKMPPAPAGGVSL